ATEVVVVQLLDRRALDGEGGACDARARERVQRCRTGPTPGFAREALARPQADEEHTLGLESRDVREQQGLAVPAAEIAAAEQRLEPAAGGGVDRPRLACELRLVEHTGNDAIDRELRQPLRPDLELHSFISSRASPALSPLWCGTV